MEDLMDGPDLAEYEVEYYPVADYRPPEEMLETRPSPAPILIMILIAIWLLMPFIASVVFLVVILGIFAIVEDPRELHSFRVRFSGIPSLGESQGLKRLRSLFGTSSGQWNVSTIVDLWNELLRSSPALQGITRDPLAVAATQVDWVETGDAHVFKADMPGLNKEVVKVEVEGDSILQISGQRSSDEDGGKDPQETWHRVERSQGHFLRRFQLPSNSEVDEVEAKVENGVLTLTVPKIKRQAVPARAVEIQ